VATADRPLNRAGRRKSHCRVDDVYKPLGGGVATCSIGDQCPHGHRRPLLTRPNASGVTTASNPDRSEESASQCTSPFDGRTAGLTPGEVHEEDLDAVFLGAPPQLLEPWAHAVGVGIVGVDPRRRGGNGWVQPARELGGVLTSGSPTRPIRSCRRSHGLRSVGGHSPPGHREWLPRPRAPRRAPRPRHPGQ